jgi:carbamoyltransferase
LDKKGVSYTKLAADEVPAKVAGLLNSEKIIGLYHGRMEYGPRALGHRSIIGDARSQKMQRIMNIKIKFRESFRPFAPSVLEDMVGSYFDFRHPSPYMLLVYDVLESKRKDVAEEYRSKKGLEKLDTVRSVVPAITHVDFSARVHTVNKEVNPFYYSIIEKFYELTGCPVIINTSFNVRGEPIVHSPEDAFRVFENTDIDYLFLESFVIEKQEKDRKNIDYEWIKQFPLD